MSTFVQTIRPTPFAFFDSDSTFQSEADSMVLFVKRKLGDDVLSVELSSREIWACFEEATLEYGRHVNEMRIKGELATMLGVSTGSNFTGKYPRQTLEYLIRQAEPYASYANVGGSHDPTLGYIDIVGGQQDYNLYSDLKIASGSNAGSRVVDSMPSGSMGRLRIVEIFHFDPIAAQHFLMNASNITNFLATNFNYESYVNSTVFYVLPVFEDVLRRTMLETAFRVRRSHYSYQLIGSNLRIFPIPVLESQQGKLYVKVMAGTVNPLSSSYQDDSINGVSDPSNAPLGNITYTNITQPGRQWIRQYTLALARELLGITRSKISAIPIPNGELTLNGDALIQQAREDKEKLTVQIREFLDEMTQDKMTSRALAAAENLQKQLRLVPTPNGKSIIIG